VTANHEKFQAHLRASNHATWLVARWLTERGRNVNVRGLHVAPRADDWQEYADQGDLEVLLRVEVKQLSADFTDAADWPFPDFMVCAKHSWDAANPKPYRYCYLNAAGTHMAILNPRKTRKSWWVVTRTDSRYDNIEQEFYVCDKHAPEFLKL